MSEWAIVFCVLTVCATAITCTVIWKENSK